MSRLRHDKTCLEQDIEDYAAELQPDGSYLHNDGDVYWYNRFGEVHREDGPAIIRYDIEAGVQWHLDNNMISFADWFKLSKCSDEQKMMYRLQYE